MSVHKDKNKNEWYFHVWYKDFAGERHQTTRRNFKLKRDAEKAQAEFLAAQQFDNKTTFKQAANAYIADKEPQLKPATVLSIRHRINRMKMLHDVPLSKMTPQLVASWYNDMLGKYALTTVDTLLGVLRSVYKYGSIRAGLTGNPFSLIQRPREKSRPVQFWTIEQYNQFRAAVDDDFFLALYDLLYYSGMREGELRGLRIEDIDFDSCIVSIRRTRATLARKDTVNAPKTPESLRDVVLPSFVRDEIENLIAQMYDPQPGDWIFDLTADRIRRRFQYYSERAGLPRIRVHDLRHSHASLLIHEGFSPVAIASRLGHKDVRETLNTYSHMYPNQQSDIAAKLDALYLASNKTVTEISETVGNSVKI